MISDAFIVALTVLFIHVTTWEGMINEWVPTVTFNWPPFLKKPIYDCPICMAPWWGFWIYVLTTDIPELVSFSFLVNMVITLFMAGGINTVLIYIISYAKECQCQSATDTESDNG